MQRTPQQEYARRATYSWREVAGALWPYLLAGAMYVAVGVWQPRVLLSWSEGIIFLLFVVWAVPYWWRRRRRSS